MDTIPLWQAVAGASFIGWAVFITIYVNCCFKRKFKFLDNPEIKKNAQYPAYVRDDFAKWSFFEMTLVGIFIFPFRFGLTFLLVFFCGLLIKIFSIICCFTDPKKEISCGFKYLSKMILIIVCRLVLFIDGFYWIKRVTVIYRNQNPKLISRSESPISIAISNHVSWWDIFYYLSSFTPGFVAKEGAKNFAFIGSIATSIQSIFINRLEKNSKIAVLKQIEERVNLIDAGKKYNPIMIFPEGSTSNGKGIINFKKGAFVSLKPIKVYAMKYTSRFNPCLNLMNEFDVLVGTCLQFYNGLTVYDFKYPIGPEKDIGAEEFAENIKLLMCDEFGFQDFHNTFEEKMDFECQHAKFNKNEFV